jgi:hypothetical protein
MSIFFTIDQKKKVCLKLIFFSFKLLKIIQNFKIGQILRNEFFFVVLSVKFGHGRLTTIIYSRTSRQRTTSICCDLWTTEETYLKLLWYRFYTTLLLRSTNRFWIGFCQNLVFFPGSCCNSTLLIYFFQYFFLSKLSTHFIGITRMDFLYGKITTAYIFYTYATKCIYYAFF